MKKLKKLLKKLKQKDYDARYKGLYRENKEICDMTMDIMTEKIPCLSMFGINSDIIDFFIDDMTKSELRKK